MIPTGVQVFLALEPIDLRWSFDRLSGAAQERIRMTNNHSERALRNIAVGRRNWLFFGSDVHATAAANLFSLIASCQLHGLDPETYLRDLIRVLPHWPRHRYLELAPKYWSRTLGRLDPNELDAEIGHLTVPPRPPPEHQPAPT